MGKRGALKKAEEAAAATPKPPVQPKRKAKAKSKAPQDPPAPDLSWDNLDAIMLHFDLRGEEALAALEEILGEEPPPEAHS